MKKPEMLEASATEFNMWLERVAESGRIDSLKRAAFLCHAIKQHWLNFVEDLGVARDAAEVAFDETVFQPEFDLSDELALKDLLCIDSLDEADASA